MVQIITEEFGEVGRKADRAQSNNLAEKLSKLELMMPSGASVGYKLTTLQLILELIPNRTESDTKEMVLWLKGHQQSVINSDKTKQDAQKFLDWIGELEQSLPQIKRETPSLPVLALLRA